MQLDDPLQLDPAPSRETTLDCTALTDLPGVGKQIAKHLARINITTIQDVLLHLPLRYQDRTRVIAIRDLVCDTEAVIEAVIQQVEIPARGRTKLLCELSDGTGKLYLRYFHLLSFQPNQLKVGTRLRCFSTVRLGPKGLEMAHPEYTLLDGKQITPETHLTPVYPTTEGLSQYMLRKITNGALARLQQANVFPELIPENMVQPLGLPTLKDALQLIHRPPQVAAVTELLLLQTPSQKRLILEELLAHRLSLLNLRQNFYAQSAIPLVHDPELERWFLAQLNFTLTQAQLRVVNEIRHDLQLQHPMLRLVQGDVGCGKTVVAAFAMLHAIASKQQAVLMAPTELLAEQQYRVLKQWFAPLNISVELLTGHIKGRARKSILDAIALGEANIILGTHALFQEGVTFSRLALIVVDEQHRFGVEQRSMLREKGLQKNFYPHQLIMTATPIPRTLAMSLYADLDCSVIDELPPKRKPVQTSVIPNTRRIEVIERIRKALLQGVQVYWVCPLIDENDNVNWQAATSLHESLQRALSGIKVGLIHGRMPADEKSSVMQAFKCNEIKLLVATTVIEVGVDVPNANVMVIENSERLGLSQLHQLRGRVGRGLEASYCILLYQQPLSAIAQQRLEVMRATNDGFKIAQHDLELRGPGEILGTRQTGELSFRIADLIRDSSLLQQVQAMSEQILNEHPHLVEPLVQRWIGNKKSFGKV